jgi:hypothetical protein
MEKVISETEDAGSVNLRHYTVKLIARYLYVSGELAAESMVADERHIQDGIPHDQQSESRSSCIEWS